MILQTPFKDSVEQRFHLVEPTDESIIAQLISDEKRDKVHPIPETVEAFIAHRIGNVYQTRQTWVLTDYETGQVSAVLYSARFDAPIMNPSDLHGDIAGILSTPTENVKDTNLESIIFYSRSSFEQGAGEDLIASVHHFFNGKSCFQKTPWLSALSPLYMPNNPEIPAKEVNFVEWLEKRYNDLSCIKDDSERLKSEALQYLAENIHGDQRFHMGNGAAIGDIKLNANTSGFADGKLAFDVIVNYVYAPLGDLILNQKYYKNRQLPLSKSLNQQARKSCGLSHRFVVL